MISDHPGGGAETPPVDGERITGPSHGDAHQQPVDGDAPRPDDWLAAVAHTAAADADAPIELLGEYLNWNPFGDSVNAQQSKASTPTRQSTCTSRRRGGCGRRYR
jgi:hypothetical protein